MNKSMQLNNRDENDLVSSQVIIVLRKVNINLIVNHKYGLSKTAILNNAKNLLISDLQANRFSHKINLYTGD